MKTEIIADKIPWIGESGYSLVPGEGNVYDAALNRIRYCYQNFDEVLCSFSGGKDSTSVLMLTWQVAREFNRLPLKVVFIDEEILDPDTISYCKTVRNEKEIQMYWFCVPMRHTFRSKTRSQWWTWDPEYKDVWARDMPEWAITEVPGLRASSSYSDVVKNYFLRVLKYPKLCCVAGIRQQESFNRRRALITGGDWMAYKDTAYTYAKPIYDWSVQDVWRAIILNRWPHSYFYDRLWMKKKALVKQRIAPWGNVAAAQETQLYPEFYPDFWQRAIARMPELRARARYGSSKLFRESLDKPASMTWQDYTWMLIEGLDPDSKKYWTREVINVLKTWADHTTIPLPEVNEGGRCWKRMASMISKNDRITGVSRDRI